MMKARHLFTTLIAIFCSLILNAQAGETTMADKMREDGRIWVVIAVILTILAGLILYLVKLDRKISKMEKQEN